MLVQTGSSAMIRHSDDSACGPFPAPLVEPRLYTIKRGRLGRTNLSVPPEALNLHGMEKRRRDNGRNYKCVVCQL
jgi:hypothetical protein